MANLASRIQPYRWLATQALHGMKKLDIAALQAAFDGR